MAVETEDKGRYGKRWSGDIIIIQKTDKSGSDQGGGRGDGKTL